MTCRGFARAPHQVQVLASQDWPLCNACWHRAWEWHRHGRWFGERPSSILPTLKALESR